LGSLLAQALHNEIVPSAYGSRGFFLYIYEEGGAGMINRKTPDLENRLLILHTIDQFGPLGSLQLLQFLAEHDLMDYITLQLTLGDLVQTGHLQTMPHALGLLHTLAPAGKESLRLFLHRLPHSIRAQVAQALPEWKKRFAQEAQMLSDFHRQEDGSYVLRLRLMEKNVSLLDMALTLLARDTADLYSRRWAKAAPLFYSFLMKELGDHFSQDTQPPAIIPVGIVLERGQNVQGCLLHLHHTAENESEMKLSVSLPTESIALFFAGRWESKADAICTFLRSTLETAE